jgi:hypothetical protein
MGLRMGLGHLSDREFVEAFEACTISGSEFHHGDHVRVAWLYVRESGEKEAEQKLLSGIRKLATHVGSPQKFHHTMTVAWLRMVVASRGCADARVSFSEWAEANGYLGDKDLLLEHYSKERLDGAEAKAGWVEPDLRPLPGR